jgi:hypothetical protein
MAVVDVNDYRLEMSVVVDCYKMQECANKGNITSYKLCEILTFNDGTVLDILLLDSELVKYTIIIFSHDDCWLVHLSYYIMFMDYLISLMNNNHFSSPLSLSHFPLIKNPSHIPYSFSHPCSEIDYSQGKFCVRLDKSGRILCGLQ